MSAVRFRVRSFRTQSGAVRVAFDGMELSGRLEKAYDALHEMAAEDMLPYMPVRTGGFRERTRAANESMVGSGQIYAGVGPMARYLYQNRVMVDAATGKGPRNIPGVGPRFQKGAHLAATDRPLRYSSPSARPAWFEAAKAARLRRWLDRMQAILDGKERKR